VAHALHSSSLGTHAPITGAVLVTCSDEAEAACARAFHDSFARYCVPALKFGQSEAFRLSTLGGQYEWGGIRTAERNYAAAGEHGERKLMVVKINAHTGVIMRSDGPSFGVFHSYRTEAPCCAALHGLLSGYQFPSEHIAEAFDSEGLDRIAVLRDPERVDPRERGLRAALVSARLQARKAVLDIQDYDCGVSTTWIVLPCVSINRRERDTEIVCGIYSTPPGADSGQMEYVGLGDDPAAYELSEENRSLLVTEQNGTAKRAARNHRELLADRAQEVAADAAKQDDPRLAEVRRAVAEDRHRHAGHSRALLSSLLLVLGEVAPVPAALLLFVQGVSGIHHTWRMHRVARDLSRTAEAREILHDLRGRVDGMSPDEREAIIEMLLR